MAKAFQVTDNFMYVYKRTKIPAPVLGRLSKSAIFSAEQDSVSKNGTWYKILSITSARSTNKPEALIGGYVLDSNNSLFEYKSGIGYAATRELLPYTSSKDTNLLSKANKKYGITNTTTPSPLTTMITYGTQQLEKPNNNVLIVRETKATQITNSNTSTSNITASSTTSNAFDVEALSGDDTFVISYQADIDINTTGLQIKDTRGILGIPPQFLPLTDPRITDSDNTNPMSLCHMGRIYTDRILAHMPLLFITPGVPKFMGSYDDEQRNIIINKLLQISSGVDVDELINENSGKLYSLKFAQTEYFGYLNPMLRSAAYFLGIQNESIDGTGNKLGNYQWLYKSTQFDGISIDLFTHEGLSKLIGPYTGCIVFYADCGNTADDSFSNQTTNSSLEETLNGLSSQGRELNFLIGNIGGTMGLTINQMSGLEELNERMGDLTSIVDNVLPGKNILSNVLGKAKTILAGGHMVFPEIWSDSQFGGRSYSCKLKLVSPSGDALSVFLNILVPIYHLMAMCLPRQSIGQSYFSPFLVRAFYKGLFNVDMGIITDLNITKGTEGEWTKDGLPTVAEVSFTIKDLYDVLYISTTDLGNLNIMNNISELDYIANSCGININDHDLGRTIKMFTALNVTGNVKDTVQLKVEGKIYQSMIQKVQDVFGAF